MTLPSKTVMEISGGSGSNAWTIRYGTATWTQKKWIIAGPNRAWLSHGGWLRFVDTDKGVIIGRWHFPGSIAHLTAAGQGVQIQIEEKENERVFTRLVTFDPQSERAIQYSPTGNLLLTRVPFNEVGFLLETSGNSGVLSQDWKPKPDVDLAKLLLMIEETGRRDPHSPLFGVAAWRLLREAKDPRAASVLEEALQIKSTDFTEILGVSSLLEALGERDLARRAFEAGYRDFLDKGNDPRLLTSLIARIIFFPTPRSAPLDLSSDRGREMLERYYRLAPYGESADLAWAAYAKLNDGQGRSKEAEVWRVRAEEAAHTSIFLVPRKMSLASDLTLLGIMAAMAAAMLYFVLLWIRYRPQRRADAARSAGRGWLRRILSGFGIQHWSRSQRFAFFSIVLAGWVAVGFESGFLLGVMRAAATPIGMTMGSFAGPVAPWYLQERMAASPQRDLLLAVAYHQSGQLDKAESLYRALPEFAESSNNLGQILRTKGKEQEARQAFEKALQLDPALGEAAVNLGEAPRGYWAEQYARMFPGRTMLAPPRPERLSSAYFHGSFEKLLLRGVGGPFVDWRSFGSLFVFTGTGSREAPAADIFSPVVVAVFLLALVALFMRPQPVTEAPSRFFVIPEVLFPGLNCAWSFLGGLVFLVWIFFLVQWIFIARIGTPFILTSIAEPSLTRIYNLPPGMDLSFAHLFNPPWTWVYLPAIVIFTVNLVVVMRSRRGSGSATSTSKST